jgi:hypothetical protein
MVLNRFIFAHGLPNHVREQVSVTAIAGGICNAIRVESLINIDADHAIKGSPILSTPIVMPLAEDVSIVAGRRYDVEITYEHAPDVTDHPRFTATLQPADDELARRANAAA